MANNMTCGNYDNPGGSQNISDFFPFLYLKSRASHLINGFTFFVCIVGLFGNGTVLWFLCSNKKRNSVMFITNLSVADFGVLSALSVNILLYFCVVAHGQPHYAIYIVHLCLHNVYSFMHYASANFLMIISIDRCVAVLFPIWHRCHHSKSSLVKTSVFLWALSCLMAGLSFFFRFCYNDFKSNITAFTIIYILVVVSTGVLLFKVCRSSHLRQRGKLLVAILISLVFFIITIPPRGFFSKNETVPSVLLFLKAVNSGINPIIYFFVGIVKAGPARKTLKAVFQKFFKEEEYVVEEGDSSTNMNSAAPTSTSATLYNCV